MRANPKSQQRSSRSQVTDMEQWRVDRAPGARLELREIVIGERRVEPDESEYIERELVSDRLKVGGRKRASHRDVDRVGPALRRLRGNVEKPMREPDWTAPRFDSVPIEYRYDDSSPAASAD